MFQGWRIPPPLRTHTRTRRATEHSGTTAPPCAPVAFTGTVMSLVLPIWWLVSAAKGDPNEVLALCCAIFGLTFSTSVAVLARRS
jgi:hypothetical protein